MDIYILDALLRPIDVVDQYISFIWAERWDSMGDFELITLATPANRYRFVADTKLFIYESKNVMIVDSVEEVEDTETGTMLKIKGRDLNVMLQKRVLAVRAPLPSTSLRPTYDTYGWTPVQLLVLWFFTICYSGELDPGDIIPFIQEEGSLYPVENIPDMDTETFQYSQKPTDLYSAMTTIAKAYDIGWRFYKDPNASKLYFEGILGCDRTTQQSDFPPVVFSQDMANLIDTTEFTDHTPYYNAVQVIYYYKDASDNDVTESYFVKADELSFSEGGFDQKTKLLNVTSLPEDLLEADRPAYLMGLGVAELGKSKPVNVYDGEAAKNGTYTYGVDYNLGDIVEVRSKSGGTAYMRVVEQIFKNDANGPASYPSLKAREFINPGTWASWKYDVEWSAMGSEEYWFNQ